jgi:hypothetical protein
VYEAMTASVPSASFVPPPELLPQAANKAVAANNIARRVFMAVQHRRPR